MTLVLAPIPLLSISILGVVFLMTTQSSKNAVSAHQLLFSTFH